MAHSRLIENFLFACSLATLLAGGISAISDNPQIAAYFWMIGTVGVLVWLVIGIGVALSKGIIGLDVIAAFSMVGSIYLGELLTGNVIAVMFAGGQLLEAIAQSRARREMTALLARSPRNATRYEGQSLVSVKIEDIHVGDHLLIRPGDVLPVDGIASRGKVLLDESVMTGESVPVEHPIGDRLYSGVTNSGGAFDMVAATDAAGSTYAAIIRMVTAAEQQKAPMARLADRYALGLFGFTACLASLAWLLSGDAMRVLAVFVVATPCPLIVAVPVAIVSGLSRCAKIGVLVKNGGALEALAAASSLLFDKTGTITVGEPSVLQVLIDPEGNETDVIKMVGSLAQGSSHSVSKSLSEYAARSATPVTIPSRVVEVPGEGVSGEIEGHPVHFGTYDFVSKHVRQSGWMEVAAMIVAQQDGLIAAIGIDGQMVGLVRFHDAIRPEAASVLRALRRCGINRIGLLTGDRRQVAEAVANGLFFDHIEAGATPAGKVKVVLREKKFAVVAMVGDGVNDAPALAAANVGIALGAKGVGASAEAADIVVLIDHLDPLPEIFRIAQSSFGIARQSVLVGIGLSTLGMLAAALGYLRPIDGAVFQEMIDVATILNALRALHIKLLS